MNKELREMTENLEEIVAVRISELQRTKEEAEIANLAKPGISSAIYEAQ